MPILQTEALSPQLLPMILKAAWMSLYSPISPSPRSHPKSTLC